jgi:phosphoribosylanthranilate isomerase
VEAADRLLFDAKPPADMKDALPGGNALALDWNLLKGTEWPCPWMLSGGLNADNLAEAVETSGAEAVDVSSGVEDRPGHKDPARIRAYLNTAAKL